MDQGQAASSSQSGGGPSPSPSSLARSRSSPGLKTGKGRSVGFLFLFLFRRVVQFPAGHLLVVESLRHWGEVGTVNVQEPLVGERLIVAAQVFGIDPHLVTSLTSSNYSVCICVHLWSHFLLAFRSFRADKLTMAKKTPKLMTITANWRPRER